MRAIINLLSGLLALFNSLFGGLFTFVLAIFTVIAAFIYDMPQQMLELIKYLGNTLINEIIDKIAEHIVSLDIFEYTYSIFDNCVSIVTWINYFFPLAECLGFAVFLLGMSMAVLTAAFLIKMIFQLVPTGG
jgi:hypothetical protein